MIVALDPMLLHVDLAVVLIVILKTVVVFGALLTATVLMIWFERKIVSDLQNRIGPNRAGPFGLLQTAGRRHQGHLQGGPPPRQRRPHGVHVRAVPLGDPRVPDLRHHPDRRRLLRRQRGLVEIFGHVTRLQLADPPIGILLVLAMSSIAVYGVMLAGWSSGSKYPLLGSVRGIGPDGLVRGGPRPVGRRRRARRRHAVDARHRQRRRPPGAGTSGSPGIVPFVVFVIAGTAELNRPPFDLVEAEQELVGGFHTEYCGDPVRPLLPGRVHEHDHDVGDHRDALPRWSERPDADRARVGSWGLIWFLLKLVVFLFVFVWFRATLPRFRYDQLMDLGWKVLIPLSLGWLLLLVALQVGDDEGWNLLARRSPSASPSSSSATCS